MRKIKDIKTKSAVLCALLLLAALMSLSGTGCLIRRFAGIRCPGCGMTSALKAVFCLDFKQAFKHHPMVWSLPFLVLYFLYDGRLFKNKTINAAVLCLILAGFLAVWIYRLTV